MHFYPRPPGGGRPEKPSCRHRMDRFLSTPSGWRATEISGIDDVFLNFYPRPPGGGRLLVNDFVMQAMNFYPRPPGGGRPLRLSLLCGLFLFLSTPSGWRATALVARTAILTTFLSTPSGWRATCFALYFSRASPFLSTPSGWRATRQAQGGLRKPYISIHALRVEGDLKTTSLLLSGEFLSTPSGWRATCIANVFCNFSIFLSTPSGWRATAAPLPASQPLPYFYPRPPGGGRPKPLLTLFGA